MKKRVLIFIFSMVITISCTTNYVSAKELSNYNQNGYSVNNKDECQLFKNNKDMSYTSYQENVDQKVVEEILNNAQFKKTNLSQDIGIHSVIIPPDGGMNVGAAWPYKYIGNTDTVNCYGYALGLTASINPGAFSNNLIKKGDSLDTVKDAVIEDMRALNRTVRPLNSATDKIDSFEYRIALRIGSNYTKWDYHFLLQTSGGTWCEKEGDYHTNDLGLINPSTVLWNNGTIKDFYDSAIIYFAISR